MSTSIENDTPRTEPLQAAAAEPASVAAAQTVSEDGVSMVRPWRRRWLLWTGAALLALLLVGGGFAGGFAVGAASSPAVPAGPFGNGTRGFPGDGRGFGPQGGDPGDGTGGSGTESGTGGSADTTSSEGAVGA